MLQFPCVLAVVAKMCHRSLKRTMVGSLTETRLCVSSETGATNTPVDFQRNGVVNGGFELTTGVGATVGVAAWAWTIRSTAETKSTLPASSIGMVRRERMDWFIGWSFLKLTLWERRI